MTEDKINHPSHYTALSVEPIVLERHCDFCSGNVLKYILRSPFKGSMLDDLKKALWYLRYLQNHPHLYHTIDRWDGDAMDELTDGEREEAATPGTFWHKRLQERLKEIGEGGAHDASKQEASKEAPVQADHNGA